MNIRELDLNLLRIFDAVHRQRSVSRAAEELLVSQPAVSQGLTRLRLVLKDALFVRDSQGVSPTAMAQALAPSVARALTLVSEALQDAESFEPGRARRTFRVHMSDIGESEFLPALMKEVRGQAPEVRIETQQLEYAQVQGALDTGQIDLAFGYLPGVDHTRSQRLFMERYVVIGRSDHPVLTDRPSLKCLSELDYVVVRQHAETARMLDAMQLTQRIRLSTPHFLVIPAIVSHTDLAVLLPLRIARKFALSGQFRVAYPRWGFPDFSVGLHWSQRAHNDSANRWLRELALRIFREPSHQPVGRSSSRRVPPK